MVTNSMYCMNFFVFGPFFDFYLILFMLNLRPPFSRLLGHHCNGHFVLNLRLQHSVVSFIPSDALESRVTKLPRSPGQRCRYLGGGYRCSHRRDRDAWECSDAVTAMSKLQSPHKSGMRGEEFGQMRYCFCAVNISGPSRITRDTLRNYG